MGTRCVRGRSAGGGRPSRDIGLDPSAVGRGGSRVGPRPDRRRGGAGHVDQPGSRRPEPAGPRLNAVTLMKMVSGPSRLTPSRRPLADMRTHDDLPRNHGVRLPSVRQFRSYRPNGGRAETSRNSGSQRCNARLPRRRTAVRDTAATARRPIGDALSGREPPAQILVGQRHVVPVVAADLLLQRLAAEVGPVRVRLDVVQQAGEVADAVPVLALRSPITSRLNETSKASVYAPAPAARSSDGLVPPTECPCR